MNKALVFLFERPKLLAGTLALVSLALYLPTWGYGALNYDDAWLIRDNPVLSTGSVSALSRVFFDLSRETRFLLGSEYLPIRDLSILADFALWQESYGAFHAVQSVLYALACAFLFWALYRWTRSVELAALTALIFATHPLHAESVSWLSERKGVLALLFVSLQLATFRRYVFATGRAEGWAWLLLTTLCTVAALWSKALSVASLAVLVALALFYAEGVARRRGLWGVAALAPVVALAFWPVWLTGARLEMVAPYHGGSFGAAALLSLKGYGFYLARAALWGEAGIAYPLALDGAGLGYLLSGSLGLVATVAMILFGTRRALRRSGSDWTAPWRPLALGAAVWLAFWTPVSQLVFPLQNAVADRYALLPSLGWALALAVALRAIPRPGLKTTLVALLCLAQIGLTLSFSRAWRSDEALYEQALAAHPRYLPALLQLSRIARQRGDHRAAEKWLAHARAVGPEDHRVLTHVALQALARGDRREALRAFGAAAKHKDAHRARANLALLLSKRGEDERALVLAREAAQLRPLGRHAQHTLGVVALQAGALDEAERALQLALRLGPRHASTHYNLAVLAAKRGARRVAIGHLERALQLAPTFAPAKKMLEALKR